MDGYFRISSAERKRLLRALHQSSRPEERLRWNILLLLVDGHTWAQIATVLYCSSATIARWQKRYLEQGMAGIAPVHESATLYWWVARIVVWVQTYTPTHFGYLRSRWCCSTLVLLLAREYNVQVSRETVRRYLHQSQLVCGVLVRSSGLTMTTMTISFGKSSVCSTAYPATRSPSSRMKPRSAQIPRFAPCG